MFEIIQEPGEPWNQWLVDEGRDVRVHMLKGERGGGGLFEMFWEHRRLGFSLVYFRDEEIGVWRRPDGTLADSRYGVSNLGGHIRNRVWKIDIPAFEFANQREREEAELLAIESILVFGGYYDGLEYEEGYWSVSKVIAGKWRRFTLADFGYHPVNPRFLKEGQDQ